jgi:hypothetical protein
MRTHPCIFCSRSHSHPPEPPSLPLPSDVHRFPAPPRTAIPVYLGRVSPVLDTCTQLCVLATDGTQAAARPPIHLKGGSIFERVEEIRTLGIDRIICGAVSESFFNLLKEAGVDLICGITGDAGEVAEAYRNGLLKQGRFRMPGAE